jgi:glucose-1-phosphate thymidylyltransferase
MKGVVLAGGRGSRLQPITFSLAKQLIPVANKPIIEFGLEDMAEAGITEVGIVVSPLTEEEIRTALGDGSRLGLSLTYILQERPLGLAHALKMALPFVAGDDCLMYLGDNIVKEGVRDVVADFAAHRPNCQIMLAPVDNPAAFGVAELTPDGEILRLVEKPVVPPSNLVLVGVYLFDPTIWEALEAVTPSTRGELEITDAIQHLIDRGRSVRASVAGGWWKDTGSKEDLLHAQELVMNDLEQCIEGEISGSVIDGAARVGRGSHLLDCRITGPAVIGEGVRMERVAIGPFTSIGGGSWLSDAGVERSIVMEGAEIHGWTLRDSVLGRGVRLRGAAPDAPAEVTLGDRSEIVGE